MLHDHRLYIAGVYKGSRFDVVFLTILPDNKLYVLRLIVGIQLI
ncbi:hypothetical protein [Pontibacter qinzhouensis]|nr:hypothetical protein [Pontibacter qinzhouensis]